MATDPQTTFPVGEEALREAARKIGGSAAWAVREIERLREDAAVLACAVLGISPDLNTQTPAEVAATKETQHAAAVRIMRELQERQHAKR